MGKGAGSMTVPASSYLSLEDMGGDPEDQWDAGTGGCALHNNDGK